MNKKFRGETPNLEVIGMLIGKCFLNNHKKYPDFDFKPLKIPQIVGTTQKKYLVSHLSAERHAR